MNRKKFLSIASIAAIISMTTTSFAKGVLLPTKEPEKKQKSKRTDKGFKVDAGKDRFDKNISLFEGDTFSTKVSTKDTDGDIFVFESVRLKNGGPALHYHFDQDEWWYVLKGEFLFKVGEETFNLKAGDSIFGPCMVPHAFAKTNEGEAKLLMFFQPAGKMEAYFKAVSNGEMVNLSDKEKNDFKEAHGFKVIGPALTYYKG